MFKKKLIKMLYKLNFKIFMRNIILMESNPDFSDNTKAVFDELINRKINQNIKIMWFVKDESIFKDINIKNVYFLQTNKNIFTKMKYLYYNVFSKYIIDCNRYIHKLNKNQFRIYLSHGGTLKRADEYIKKCGETDYIVALSDYLSNYYIDTLNIKKDKILIDGFPRNDYLFEGNKYFKDIYKKNNEKIIVWLPTYRNKFNGKEFNNSITTLFSFGIPCISNFKELNELNELLKEKNIVILIKFHPSEKIDELMKRDLSNIRIINDTIFCKNHTNLYQLLSIADALITDYSSVYYDFLLKKKKIGLAIPDFEEYRKIFDLYYDNFEENLEGDFIYNYDDLKKFVINVDKNDEIDYSKSIKKFHKYMDNKSSERIVNVLINKINNKRNGKKDE